MVKNKKGWTAVVEVFISILLLAGVLTILLGAQSVMNSKGEKVYEEQAAVLKKIQMNDELRENIINGEVSQEINDVIIGTIFSDMECQAKICILNEECNLENLPEKKEIFAKSVLITSTNEIYNPKELKLFCWEK